MAREWWQFSNWPDGTSGTSPGVTGLDPNAVEPWPAGTNPKACTVFRKEFLNQFIAWKYYLAHQLPNEQTWWLQAYNLPIQHNTSFLWASTSLQDPYFWLQLATLDITPWFDGHRSRMCMLPTDGFGGEIGFVANTEFDTRVTLALREANALPNDRAFHYANINDSPIKDLQFNVREILRIIRGHYDSAGVHDAGLHIEIGGVRCRSYGGGRWRDAQRLEYRSYPVPNYPNYGNGGQYWTDYVRAHWPYPARGGPNDTLLKILQYPAVSAWTSPWVKNGSNVPGVGGITFITGIDVYRLTDTNYRYAVYSTGDPDDSRVGGYFVPLIAGYCHAVFELPTSINLDNPPSRIIHVTGLGNGNYQSIQTANEISLSRGVGVASFPYDRIPDDYKGPDWPTVEGQPYLPNDRHNSWLDNHSQGS